MKGNSAPVFTGKNPGPKILAAWAEQERQDAKAAAKEAEFWGDVGDIEIDLDTLDLTPKPALSHIPQGIRNDPKSTLYLTRQEKRNAQLFSVIPQGKWNGQTGSFI